MVKFRQHIQYSSTVRNVFKPYNERVHVQLTNYVMFLLKIRNFCNDFERARKNPHRYSIPSEEATTMEKMRSQLHMIYVPWLLTEIPQKKYLRESSRSRSAFLYNISKFIAKFLMLYLPNYILLNARVTV
jgi:hypothetical protein